MVKPMNCCCCCVPACCGLRGGVLAIAIIQLICGIYGVIYFGLLAISGTTATIQAAANQGLDVPSAAYVLTYSILSLISGVLQLIGGIIGIQATASIQKVLSLDPATVKRSRTYWQFYTAIYVIGVILSTITASMQTSAAIQTYSSVYSSSQIASVVIWVWVYWVIAVLLNFYFVFVVFSYMKTLELAAAGNLGSLPFVVKNQYPMAYPAAGHPQQVPPYTTAQGQPVQVSYAQQQGGVEMPKV